MPNYINIVVACTDDTVGCHLATHVGGDYSQRVIGDSREFDSAPSGHMGALMMALNVIKRTTRPLRIFSSNGHFRRLLAGKVESKKHEQAITIINKLITARGTTISDIRDCDSDREKYALDFATKASEQGKRIDKVWPSTKK